MAIELDPCPFCGNNMDLQYQIDPEDTIYPVNRNHTVWNIVCCTLNGGCDCSVLGSSPEECITKWNRRTNK